MLRTHSLLGIWQTFLHLFHYLTILNTVLEYGLCFEILFVVICAIEIFLWIFLHMIHYHGSGWRLWEVVTYYHYCDYDKKNDDSNKANEYLNKGYFDLISKVFSRYFVFWTPTFNETNDPIHDNKTLVTDRVKVIYC